MAVYNDVQTYDSSLAGLRIAAAVQDLDNVRALQSSAVYRGRQLIAGLVSSIPIYAQTGGDPALTRQKRIEQPVRLDQAPQILVTPNVFMDRDEFIRQVVLSMIDDGNAYIAGSLFDDQGRPTNLDVVNPRDVSVTGNELGTRPIYEWRNRRMRPGVDFWHIPMDRAPGKWKGDGPLTAGAKVINGVLIADDYARRLFNDSGVPAGTLTVPGSLTKDEADRLKDQWERQHANGRGTAVLSGGIEYKSISLTPDQAQFLATRAYGAQEIARLLGIPQWFLNAGSPPGTASALTYQNLAQVFNEMARTTLYPVYFRRIESFFSSLLPRGQAAKFDYDEWLRDIAALETGTVAANNTEEVPQDA